MTDEYPTPEELEVLKKAIEESNLRTKPVRRINNPRIQKKVGVKPKYIKGLYPIKYTVPEEEWERVKIIYEQHA